MKKGRNECVSTFRARAAYELLE